VAQSQEMATEKHCNAHGGGKSDAFDLDWYIG